MKSAKGRMEGATRGGRDTLEGFLLHRSGPPSFCFATFNREFLSAHRVLAGVNAALKLVTRVAASFPILCLATFKLEIP